MLLPLLMVVSCSEDKADEPESPDAKPETPLIPESAPAGSTKVCSLTPNFDSDKGLQNGDELQVIVNTFHIEYQGKTYPASDCQLEIDGKVLPTNVLVDTSTPIKRDVLSSVLSDVEPGRKEVIVRGRFEIPGYGKFSDTATPVILWVYKEKPRYDIRIGSVQYNQYGMQYVNENGELIVKYQIEPEKIPYNYGLDEDFQNDEILLDAFDVKGGQRTLLGFYFVALSNFDADIKIQKYHIGKVAYSWGPMMMEYEEHMADAKTITVDYIVNGICEGNKVQFQEVRTFKVKIQRRSV